MTFAPSAETRCPRVTRGGMPQRTGPALVAGDGFHIGTHPRVVTGPEDVVHARFTRVDLFYDNAESAPLAGPGNMTKMVAMHGCPSFTQTREDARTHAGTISRRRHPERFEAHSQSPSTSPECHREPPHGRALDTRAGFGSTGCAARDFAGKVAGSVEAAAVPAGTQQRSREIVSSRPAVFPTDIGRVSAHHAMRSGLKTRAYKAPEP